jgi:hypothetical protein
MTLMRYLGPADLMTLDGLEIKRGDTVELDELQIRRLRDAGAELEIVPAPAPATASTKKPAPPAKED